MEQVAFNLPRCKPHFQPIKVKIQFWGRREGKQELTMWFNMNNMNSLVTSVRYPVFMNRIWRDKSHSTQNLFALSTWGSLLFSMYSKNPTPKQYGIFQFICRWAGLHSNACSVTHAPAHRQINYRDNLATPRKRKYCNTTSLKEKTAGISPGLHQKIRKAVTKR